MADLDPRPSAREDEKPVSAPLPANAAAKPHRNGTEETKAVDGEARVRESVAGGADGSPQSLGEEGDDRSGLDRAEEIVDHLAAKAFSLVGRWGRKFLRLTSRARESAQDFWAEVQDFRHGNKP